MGITTIFTEYKRNGIERKEYLNELKKMSKQQINKHPYEEQKRNLFRNNGWKNDVEFEIVAFCCNMYDMTSENYLLFFDFIKAENEFIGGSQHIDNIKTVINKPEFLTFLGIAPEYVHKMINKSKLISTLISYRKACELTGIKNEKTL